MPPRAERRGALAENVAHLGKGERVLVHGWLSQRGYETTDGDKRTVWEFTAEEIGLSVRYAPPRGGASATWPEPAPVGAS